MVLEKKNPPMGELWIHVFSGITQLIPIVASYYGELTVKSYEPDGFERLNSLLCILLNFLMFLWDYFKQLMTC